jgi:hypothetical protein
MAKPRIYEGFFNEIHISLNVFGVTIRSLVIGLIDGFTKYPSALEPRADQRKHLMASISNKRKY